MRYLKNIILLLLIAGVFYILLPACGDDSKSGAMKPKKIDFKNVEKEARENPVQAERPKMRIAIAAMISPKYTYENYENLLKFVGDRLNADMEFIQKKTYDQVNEMLKKRELELAFVCSGPYVKGKNDFGMEMIAVPVSHGKKVYYSYFIVKKDSPIKSFEQLRGLTFAFTDPHSNTGYIVPAYYLAKRQETPDSFFKETFFTYSHDNSIKAVADGMADGAAVDSLIWEFMNATDSQFTSQTRIIEKSPPYGIPPVVVHPSMDQQMKDKIRSLFLSIHEDPRGREILKNLQIDRFEPGYDTDYNSVREMMIWLDSQKDT